MVLSAILEQHDSNLRVDGPGRPNDIGIKDRWIETYASVLHVKSAVKCDTVFVRVSRRELDGFECRFCLNDGGDNFLDQLSPVGGTVIGIFAMPGDFSFVEVVV